MSRGHIRDIQICPGPDAPERPLTDLHLSLIGLRLDAEGLTAKERRQVLDLILSARAGKP